MTVTPDAPTQERDTPFDTHYRFPADLDRAHLGARGTVAVIGGGVSGLACAYELTRRGLDVTVYERADRPGGRVRTHRFWDGTHGELGAMRLPANHHTTLHYVREFALPTRPFVNASPDTLLHLRGTRLRASDADRAPALYGLQGAEDRDPRVLLDSLLHDIWDTLTPEQHRAVLRGDVDGDPVLEELMARSLWQHARQRLTPAAWELVGQASGLAQYEHACLLEVLVDYFGLFHVAQLELVGGTDQLVSAFVRRLPPGTLRLGTTVDRVRTERDGVRILGQRFGERFEKPYDWVVCALPAPALDRVRFEPALPAAQQAAIRGIHYASSSKTLVHVERRLWEQRDGVFGGGSFTDLPVQQVWYPSDNADARDPDRSAAPAVLTGAYQWESSARRFALLPEAERTARVLQSLEELHPGISDTVDDVVHWSWDAQLGGGAFAYLAPGQHGRYLGALGAAHPAPAPRVFFAGEQLSVAHAWIQGALESALHAVRAVLERAGARVG
ncbi:FAD-dependent oxidoreductase [Streptomyces sp. SID8379]|uniref:flavin monoamine oxidase family protein n=1 Tax=unclassified Streptomyces TaxID=2593676 RepID=UPI0003778DAA|nr:MULTISPECIES: NAD(P)/FAD-dependent oxidoreductase [unclassified Streptomyces]MYW63617.1 FAD-dependent oxidoreductase [Streptomyces sp. SID8379]